MNGPFRWPSFGSIWGAAGGDPAPDPDPQGGPERTPTADTGNVVFAGHSSLQSFRGPLGNLWTSGDMLDDFGPSSQAVWGNDGETRNSEYAYLLLTEEDQFDTTGWPAPNTPEGQNSLQHLYWLALEAKDRGAHTFLYLMPSHQFIDLDAHNRQAVNYTCEWLRDHLEQDVWVLDAAYIVRRMQALGVPDAEIYSDPLHYSFRASRAFAYAAHAMITGAVDPDYQGLDAQGYQAVNELLDSYWWAGLGGAERNETFDIADPLPSPLPRPDDPDPVDGILWTSDGYQGPVLTGTQPTIAGNVLTFDGSGLSGALVTEGFYACLAVREAGTVNDRYMLFVNPNPADMFADPFGGVAMRSGAYAVERWPDFREAILSPRTADEWTVIEAWVIGAAIGGRVGASDTDGTAADTPQPETGFVSLFDIGGSIDVAYLRIERTMPDETQRAAFRAAAQARVGG